jgi:hypothetical protein
MDSNDDPFCDAPGARLSQSTRAKYLFGWRRFLGFLAISEPLALDADPAERLTIERVRAYVSQLAKTNVPQSLAARINELYQTARILMPKHDWTWLRAVKAKLHAAAPARGRCGSVITSVQLVDLGQELMDGSKPMSEVPIRGAHTIRLPLQISVTQ